MLPVTIRSLSWSCPAVAAHLRGTKIPEQELRDIMTMADVDGDGQVGYEEFLAATLHLSRLEEEEVLQQAFEV